MSQEKKILAGQIWSLTKDAKAALQAETNTRLGSNVKIVLFNDDESIEVDCIETGVTLNVAKDYLDRFIGWAPKDDEDEFEEEETNFRKEFLD